MQKQRFHQDWRFNLGDIPGGRWKCIDDSTWRSVELPHDWSIELDRSVGNPSGNSGGFFPMGTGVYQKTFIAPQDWRGKKVFVEFEGVYMNTECYLNRDSLGIHPYGYTSFLLDLTPYLKIGEKNVLRVVVDNASQLNSRWYSGSGIYRPVWLIVSQPVHVAHWGVYVTTPQVSLESAIVLARTVVQNETDLAKDVTLRTAYLAPDGVRSPSVEASTIIPAAGRFEFTQELPVNSPELWSVDTPYLYRLESEVILDGQVMDAQTTTFGIRSLSFSAGQGFMLNGKPMKMKGGCVHHDNGILGAASYERSEERKVELLKASGHNAIRCAHNPPSPAFLDACDRLGMLVMDEAFDCWRQGKNPYDYHVVFDDWWSRDVASMVQRDRNHPSIVIWSIGNEVLERDGRSGGAEIAQKLAEAVRQLDPTRPVTSAICGVWDGGTWTDTDVVFDKLDVGGYNYQFANYRPDHERHPQRIMVGTETVPKEAFENWMSVLELDYVIGDFVWTSLDYLGEAGIGRVHFQETDFPFLGEYPWHQANCGDLDLCGFKRPQSYYRDILWEHGDKLYVAVHPPYPEGKIPRLTYWGWPDVWHNWTWPGHEGQNLKVDVYSRCEAVELFLNGASLGIQPSTRTERFTASFEVSYQPGELKAVGFIDGQPAAEFILQTVGDPVGIRLVVDRSPIRCQPGDLCYVTAEVVDAVGRVHPSADNEIFFTVKGNGSLLALGSSHPVSQERYTGNQRRAFRGRCLAVIKPLEQPGEIRLRAQADGLDGTEIVIVAE
jgi:beta-galactosidase